MFSVLPEEIKNELKIMCVLFTEDVGGILKMEFEEDTLLFKTEADEEDLLYDEIGSVLKIKQLQYEKQESADCCNISGNYSSFDGSDCFDSSIVKER